MTSDHNLQVTAPDEKNLQESTARISGPCGACHIPHNASGKRLWAKPLSAEKDLGTQLCTGCHNKNGAAKEKLTGDNSHRIDVLLKETKIGHFQEQVAAELPLYGEDGDRMDDGRIFCLTCHEPHSWDPRISGQLKNYEPQNVEGDTTNSFLRRANSPSAELCNICHVNEARVEDTVHNLNKTAPKAENFLGQTVKTSGSCGACHLVHNAPNKLKLWARPYGPIPEKANAMDGLCTSCHSKGNIAEKKIPAIATHPAEKLLSNITTLTKKGTNYMPLFDGDGRAKNVGNMSCPTCHNAHEWGPAGKEMAAGKGAKGNTLRSFRFLRNMSYNTFCMDCHGPDAIYRYMYFHDPEKRIIK